MQKKIESISEIFNLNKEELQKASHCFYSLSEQETINIFKNWYNVEKYDYVLFLLRRNYDSETSKFNYSFKDKMVIRRKAHRKITEMHSSEFVSSNMKLSFDQNVKRTRRIKQKGFISLYCYKKLHSSKEEWGGVSSQTVKSLRKHSRITVECEVYLGFANNRTMPVYLSSELDKVFGIKTKLGEALYSYGIVTKLEKII